MLLCRWCVEPCPAVVTRAELREQTKRISLCATWESGHPFSEGSRAFNVFCADEWRNQATTLPMCSCLVSVPCYAGRILHLGLRRRVEACHHMQAKPKNKNKSHSFDVRCMHAVSTVEEGVCACKHIHTSIHPCIHPCIHNAYSQSERQLVSKLVRKLARRTDRRTTSSTKFSLPHVELGLGEGNTVSLGGF